MKHIDKNIIKKKKRKIPLKILMQWYKYVICYYIVHINIKPVHHVCTQPYTQCIKYIFKWNKSKVHIHQEQHTLYLKMTGIKRTSNYSMYSVNKNMCVYAVAKNTVEIVEFVLWKI